MADHFTKLLQGLLFRKFRAAIMNCPINLPNEFNPLVNASKEIKFASCVQECVGPNGQTRLVPVKEPGTTKLARITRRHMTCDREPTYHGQGGWRTKQ